MEENLSFNLSDLENKSLNDLHELANQLACRTATGSGRKDELIARILQTQTDRNGPIIAKGILEILPDGWGFLRRSNFSPNAEDIYVAQAQIKRFGLKTGDEVTRTGAPAQGHPRSTSDSCAWRPSTASIPEVARNRVNFDDLTPIYPNERLILETTRNEMTGRIMDLISPIGKGQRGMIVAQPKAGKTTILKTIANSIATNHPECVLIVLLIDERPEEVTDIRRSVKGEVISSTFDETPENHMRVADMVLEQAKRLAESKRDVVVLMDSLTRLHQSIKSNGESKRPYARRRPRSRRRCTVRNVFSAQRVT